ncbi:MAG: hypothetical protein LBC41_05735 [Clostridiales bacterium]|jgi:hypothetical protein|nr:hypothetical protein [Clostridiales bacterium]MDR2750141.1 hypothetical protein [Clostridiales bacterium]
MSKALIVAAVSAVAGFLGCFGVLNGLVLKPVEAATVPIVEEASFISPDELAVAVMRVPLRQEEGKRYKVFMELAEKQGFAGKLSESKEVGTNFMEIYKVSEKSFEDKQAVVLAANYNGKARHYLLFVKEGGAWSMNSVSYANSRIHDFVDIAHTPGFENVWLVYELEEGHGTGYSGHQAVWVDRWGSEAIRYQSSEDMNGRDYSKSFTSVWEASLARDKNVEKPVDPDEFKVYVSCYGSYETGAEKREASGLLVYRWVQEEGRFVFDDEEGGSPSPEMTASRDAGTQVSGSSYYSYMTDINKLMAEQGLPKGDKG